MTDDPHINSAARAGVARTASAEPGRIRKCSATALLALLSAAAIAPLLVSGVAPGAALLGVAGNIGGGVLAGLLQTATGRMRDGKPGPAKEADIRDGLAADLLAALKQGDAAAQELRIGLTDLLVRIGGVEAAIEGAQDDVRSHLESRFGQLAGQQDEAIQWLRKIGTGQGQQERRLSAQTRAIEQLADRLTLLTVLLRERRPEADEQPGRPVVGPPTSVRLVVPSATTTVSDWAGGAQIVIGECVYLLHDEFLDERFAADRSVRFRRARALRITPTPARGQEYAWLRQAERREPGPASEAAVAALRREHDLLSDPRVTGMPRVLQLTADETTTTLASGWPGSSTLGGPCEVLAASLSPGGVRPDTFAMFRLFTGLAGLCSALAGLHKVGVAHRFLTPAGIIELDNGRLVLRDAGLAGYQPRPGEGPADYAAPEQSRGAAGRPGAPTDSYQLAAVTYHLLAGHPPHARVPLPLRAQVPEVPEPLSAAVAAALAADPASRPDIRSLGEAFISARISARDKLS